ncbi:MAG: hypothetical protein ACRC2J_11300, partial [Microcoleaceae cyanobacterium]
GTNKPIILSGHRETITGLEFTQEFLVSVGIDQTMRIWDTELDRKLPDNLLKYSCHFLQDYLKGQYKKSPHEIPNWFDIKHYCQGLPLNIARH